MLNTLRSKQKSILWFLVILITPAFIIWGTGSGAENRGAPGVAAKLNGEKIPYEEFYQYYSQSYEQMAKFYENYYGSITKEQKEAIHEQAKGQALSQLINQHLLLQYAEKNGFTVTALEIKEALGQHDVFKTDGRFDEEKWKMWVRNMPADRLAEIEDSFSREILAQKALSYMKESLTVTEREVKDYYLAQNLRVSFSYAHADLNDFTSSVNLKDDDLRAYYQAKKENWRHPREILVKYVPVNPAQLSEHYTVEDKEARKYFEDHKENYQRENEVNVEYIKIPVSQFTEKTVVSENEIAAYYRDHQKDFDQGKRIALRYAFLDGESLDDEITITESEREAYYEAHKEEFKVPERARARHILFTVGPNATAEEKKEAETRAREVLEKAKAGEDFAQLALEYSQGPTGQAGGDLGYFKRGDMVEAFDKTVFEKLKIGEISGLVETQYGFHIIKLEDRQESHYPSWDEGAVATDIDRALKEQKRASILKHRAEDIDKMIEAGLSLEEISQTAGMRLEKTGLLTEAETRRVLVADQHIVNTLFSAPLRTLTGPFTAGDALIVAEVERAEKSHVLPLSNSTVRNNIIQQVKKEKAFELARKEARRIHEQMAAAGVDAFRDTAKEREYIPFQTGFFEPGYQSFVPGFGYDMDFKRSAFALKYGDISEPVRVNDGYVIMHLAERRTGYLPSYEEAKGRVVEELKYQKALKNLPKVVKEISKDARDGEVSSVLKDRYQLRVQAATSVSRDNLPSFVQQIMDPAKKEKTVGRILKGKEGTVLKPLYIGDTAYVLWLSRVEESFIPEYEAIKPEVVSAYIREKAQEAAYAALLKVPPLRMDNVSASQKAGPFSPEDLKTVWEKASEGSVYIDRGDDLYYINNITIDTTVVDNMTREDYNTARDGLHNEKFNSYITSWIEQRRNASKVKVYVN